MCNIVHVGTVYMSIQCLLHLRQCRSSFLLLGIQNYALPPSQAAQSSFNGGNFYATRANDGAVGAGTAYITHTLERADEWLKIELEAYIYLVQMIIYNRDGDCSGTNCGERYQNTPE